MIDRTYRAMLVCMLLLFCHSAFGKIYTISISDTGNVLRSCVDFVEQAYRAKSIDYELVPFSLSRSLKAVNEGVLDAEMCRIDDMTEEYPNLIKVNVPIANMKVLALWLNDNVEVSQVADLKRYKVGGIRGMKALEKYSDQFEITLTKRFSELEKLLEEGFVDVMITSDLQKKNNPKMQEFILETYPMYHYLHQSNKQLVPILERQMTLLLR